MDWPDDRFSPAELATLKAEPMLQVLEVEEGPCRDGEEKAPDGHKSGAEAAGSPPEGSGEVEQPPPPEAQGGAEPVVENPCPGSEEGADKPRNKGTRTRQGKR